MSDAHIPPPLGYVPDPIRPHTVVIEFDVLARSQADADHLVDEVLIEDLAGDPATLRTEGARVFGEDYGDDVASIRSWIPSTEQPAQVAAVPSAAWEPFRDSGIPEIVAEMFPPEPHRRDYLAADGAADVDGFADAYQQWQDECLSLAAQAARLPELLDRLAGAEAVRDGLIELVEREPLPVEPQKEDYLVTVAPSYEGEIVGAAYRWDHVQWQADFTAAARRRENALHGLLAEGGRRATFLPDRVSQGWVPADLLAIQTLRVLVEQDTAEKGASLLARAQRKALERTLFAADPEVRVADPDDPDGVELFAGQASEAHDWLSAGVYDATGPDGHGTFRLVVGPVGVGDAVTASAAFPPAEHDATVMNQIARILEQDTEHHPPREVLERINTAVGATGRTVATPADLEGKPTLLERGVLLSELLAEREHHLDNDGPDDPSSSPPGRDAPRSL